VYIKYIKYNKSMTKAFVIDVKSMIIIDILLSKNF